MSGTCSRSREDDRSWLLCCHHMSMVHVVMMTNEWYDADKQPGTLQYSLKAESYWQVAIINIAASFKLIYFMVIIEVHSIIMSEHICHEHRKKGLLEHTPLASCNLVKGSPSKLYASLNTKPPPKHNEIILSYLTTVIALPPSELSLVISQPRFFLRKSAHQDHLPPCKLRPRRTTVDTSICIEWSTRLPHSRAQQAHKARMTVVLYRPLFQLSLHLHSCKSKPWIYLCHRLSLVYEGMSVSLRSDTQTQTHTDKHRQTHTYTHI